MKRTIIISGSAAAAYAAAASASAAAAAASAVAAANAVVGNFLGGVAGASVPATATAAGDYYRVTSAGTSQGKTWSIGDFAIYEGTSGNWTQISGTGNVTGPVSSTDNAIVRFDSTTGKVVQNSGVIIDDSNNVTGVVALTMSGNLTVSGTGLSTFAGGVSVKGNGGANEGLYFVTTNGTYYNFRFGTNIGDVGRLTLQKAATAGGAATDYETVVYFDNAKDAYFTGRLITGTPAGGTAGAWKFGIKVDATVALDTTKYIQLEVGGTLYKLALAT